MSRFFFVLVLLFASHVQAESISATATNNGAPPTQYVWRYVNGGSNQSTALAACTSVGGSSLGSCSSTQGGVCVSYYCNGKNYTVDRFSNGTACNAGDVLVNGSCITYSCPTGQNWTLSGASCTRSDCAVGETRLTDGTCAAPCQNGYTRSPSTGQCVYNCSSVQGWVGGQCVDCAGRSDGGFSGAYSWANSPGTAAPAGGCGANFCYYPTVAKVQQGTKNVFQFASTSSGTSCTPGADSGTPAPNGVTTPATNTPEGCLAQGKGYVTGSSGTTSCVNAADAPTSTPVKTTSTDTTKTTNPDNTTTQKTETTSTECSGGNCTTTKSTTTAAGTTTTEENQTADAYCQQNPNAPMCKQKDDECKDHPERLGCSEFGDPVEGEALGTKAIGTSSINQVSVGSNASCPADVNLSHGVKFSYQYVCMYASGLRPVIIALAWLAAGFLIFGMKLE